VTIPDLKEVTMLGELTLEEAAQEAAGNWRKFDCFCWHRSRDVNESGNWAILYTHNRDSRLLDQSNAAIIDQAMESFADGDDPDVMAEHHGHWACGWIDGWAIRVYRDGQITEAFRKYHELAERLANYPVLDEEDYGRRELEATLANIPDAAWRLKHDYDLPEDWEEEIYQWFSDNMPGAVENRDDQGGYPSEDQLRAAFEALGYQSAVME
jgi:hypothetical protein